MIKHEKQTMTMTVRAPCAAGQFYPRNASVLENTVCAYLNRAQGTPSAQVRGLIVPHAAYLCSGVVAGCGFKTLTDLPALGHTVYLMGPAHWLPVHGVGLPSVHNFATPLGLVPVATQRVDQLLERDEIYQSVDAAHEPEHCLEVELPFLQMAVARFRIVPMLFDEEVDPERVSHDLVDLLPYEPSLVVVSSDLSHFHSYAEAERLDRKFLDAVVAGDIAGARKGQACGLLPILSLMHVAHHFGWRARLLDYRNSGDTCGSKQSVVGYSAVAYSEGNTA